MWIAIFQGPEQAKSPEQAVELLARQAADAASRGARLLICPEMYLTGYNIGPDAARRLAEAPDGASARAIMRIARETGIAILYGYPERGAGGHIYNTAQLIDRTGRIVAAYRKTHLFGEIDRAAFSAGATLPEIVELEGLKIGILICYDVEFPENVRTLALKGADLVAVPTALMQPFDIVARTIVPARAYENQVCLAYADRCGTEGELSYCGLSCVIAPDGSDLARAGRSEALIIADLDAERLAQSRNINTHLKDRRPDLYGALGRAQGV
jgi:predicted amidohydrolase